MASRAAEQRAIGIRHYAKLLRGEGLIPEGMYYPQPAADRIKRRAANRVRRCVNRILEDVAHAIRTGKLSRRLRKGSMGVRVGTDLLIVPVSVR